MMPMPFDQGTCRQDGHPAPFRRIKANVNAPAAQARLVAGNVTTIVLANSGHWIMEEGPKETMAALVDFLR